MLPRHRVFRALLAHQRWGAEKGCGGGMHGALSGERLWLLEEELWFGRAGGVVRGQAQHPLKE